MPTAKATPKRKMKAAYKCVYMRNVPAALHDLFHGACATRGRKMREVLMQFMEAYAKNPTILSKR